MKLVDKQNVRHFATADQWFRLLKSLKRKAQTYWEFTARRPLSSVWDIVNAEFEETMTFTTWMDSKTRRPRLFK